MVLARWVDNPENMRGTQLSMRAKTTEGNGWTPSRPQFAGYRPAYHWKCMPPGWRTVPFFPDVWTVMYVDYATKNYIPSVMDESGSVARGSGAEFSAEKVGSSACDVMAAWMCATIGPDSVPELIVANILACNSSKRVMG